MRLLLLGFCGGNFCMHKKFAASFCVRIWCCQHVMRHHVACLEAASSPLISPSDNRCYGKLPRN